MSNNNKNERLIWGAKADLIPYLGDRPFFTGRKACEIVAALTYQGEWRKRGLVESDRAWRQVIPYVIITNAKNGKYVLVERTTKQTEARLHNNVYFGLGGHIEEEDIEDSGRELIIKQAAEREVAEEVGISTGIFNFAGVMAITDPAEDEVHHVHIAVVYHLFTTETDFSGEIDEQNAEWVDFSTLAGNYSKMERWSQVIWHNYLNVSP